MRSLKTIFGGSYIVQELERIIATKEKNEGVKKNDERKSNSVDRISHHIDEIDLFAWPEAILLYQNQTLL